MEATAPEGRRPWPVTISALLLFLEGVGLAGVGLFLLDLEVPEWVTEIPLVGLRLHVAGTLGVLAAFLAAIAFFTALAFLRVYPPAWPVAVMIQGLVLLAALLLRFNAPAERLHERATYVCLLYGALIFGIVMTLYLNVADVHRAFRPRKAPHHGRVR